MSDSKTGNRIGAEPNALEDSVEQAEALVQEVARSQRGVSQALTDEAFEQALMAVADGIVSLTTTAKADTQRVEAVNYEDASTGLAVGLIAIAVPDGIDTWAVADSSVNLALLKDLGWTSASTAYAELQEARDAALENEIPFSLKSSEERWEFLLRFSTSPIPKGLGLSADQFWRMQSADWLEHYGAWRRTHEGERLGKPKGKRGRPPENVTAQISRAWIEADKPAVTPKLLSQIAQNVFRSDWDRATTEAARRTLRERVRATLA